MRQIILFIVLITLVCSVQAKTLAVGKVDRIYPNGNHIHFRLKNDSCISGLQYYYFNLLDSSGNRSVTAQAWYSLLLSASVSGAEVSVSVVECGDEAKIPVSYIFQDF